MEQLLSDTLADRKMEFQRVAPESAQKVMQQSLQQLKTSDILDNVKKKGNKALDFVLKNVQGESVDFEKLRKEKRVVICFYRGSW